jgi:hypothetical protein
MAKRRWECHQVKFVSVPVSVRDWRYLLETLAKELYDLSHQLREKSRSNSLHHPGNKSETLIPAETTVGEDDGAWNGKQSLTDAA